MNTTTQASSRHPTANTVPTLTLLSSSSWGTFPRSGPTSDPQLSFRLTDPDYGPWKTRLRWDSNGWDTGSTLSSTGEWVLTFHSWGFTGTRMAGGVHVLSLSVVDNADAQSNVLYVTYEVPNDPPTLELLSPSYWGGFSRGQPDSDQTIEFRLTDQDTRRKWTVLRRIEEKDWMNSGVISPGVHRVTFQTSEFPDQGGVGHTLTAEVYVVTDLWTESNTLKVTYQSIGDLGSSSLVAPVIGIVATVIVVVIVVTTICICVRRRRKAREQAQANLSDAQITAPTYGSGPQGGYLNPYGPPVVYQPQYSLQTGYESPRK